MEWTVGLAAWPSGHPDLNSLVTGGVNQMAGFGLTGIGGTVSTK